MEERKSWTSSPQPETMEPLSIPQILAQTLRIPAKSPKLAVLLAVVYLVVTSLLFASNFFVIIHDIRPMLGFLLRDIFVVEDYDGPKADRIVDAAAVDAENDVMQMIKKEFFYWVVSYLISVCMWTFTVQFTEIAHLGKQVPPRELLSRTLGSLQGTLVTCLFASLLITIYLVALFLSLGLLVHLLHSSRAIMIPTFILFAIPAVLTVLFLSFLCDLARVVSVLEGSYGPTAFAKAWEILKERRLQGFLLTFILLVVALVALQPLHLMENRLMMRAPLGVLLAVGNVKVCVMGLLTMFSMMTFAVFYLDCKRCYGQRTASVGVELQFDKLISEGLSDEEDLFL